MKRLKRFYGDIVCQRGVIITWSNMYSDGKIIVDHYQTYNKMQLIMNEICIFSDKDDHVNLE